MINICIKNALKNRLTWIIFIIVLLGNLFVCFIDIYKVYNNYIPTIDSNYNLVLKPYFADEFFDFKFFNSFSATFVLTIPLLVFINNGSNKAFSTVCKIRGNQYKVVFLKSLTNFILSYLFYNIIYIFCFLSFYFTFGKNADFSNYFMLVNNYALYNFCFNNSNLIVLFILLIGLISGVIYSSVVFSISLFINIFPPMYQKLSFVLSFYAYTFFILHLLSNKIDSGSIVEILYWINLDAKMLIKSILTNILFAFGLSIVSIIMIIVKNKLWGIEYEEN